MIAFPCEHCRRSLKVKDDMAGKKGKCPHCGQPMRVPATVPGGISHDAATLLPNAPFAATRAPGPAPLDTQALADDASHSPAGSASAEAVSVLAPPQQPGELGRLGPYRVLGVLGQGGMGVVYKAEDPHLERPVALKAMLPAFGASSEARQRFLREAKAAAAVNHDHVVTIYQVGEDRGVPFLAMEFLEGEPLDARLKRVPRPPLEEVLRIARETAEGLAAAHEKGLIHRDIKPANIWLEGSRRRVKILDFGLARGGSGQDQAQLTQTGAIMGTPAFMAPEQARGETVDARCDLFSLGCVLYRMCSGELPFKGNDPISTLMAVATVTPPALNTLNADVPAALSKLVSRLLAKNRADRPATAHKVAEELTALERSLAAEAPTARVSSAPTRPIKEDVEPIKKSRTGSPRRRPKPVQQRAWFPFALIGAAVVLIGVGIVAAQLIIRIKNKDGTETKIETPMGSKVTVETPKGGKVTIEESGKTDTQKPAQKVLPPSALFNGKDLTGWEGRDDYWQVKDGAIVGSPPGGRGLHTFLCSKKKYRDFELKFQVRRKDGNGNSGVQFRSRIKDGTPYTVIGPQCEIDSASAQYPPGSLITEPNLKPLAVKSPQAAIARSYKDADFNDFLIRCVGKHVTIKVNGVTAIDDDFPSLPDEGIIAWQLHGGRPPREITFRNIEFTELADGPAWVPLFNGKDLTGWKVFPSGTDNWRVENGAITCSGPSSHLFSKRDDYENFHFRVEAKINARGNSGQFFRTQFARGPLAGKGYEAQIALKGGDRNYWTGSLFGMVKVAEELHNPDEWVTQEVIADGDHIIIKVNGKITVDTHDRKYRKGHFALQHLHSDTWVRFRKIEVKELPPSDP